MRLGQWHTGHFSQYTGTTERNLGEAAMSPLGPLHVTLVAAFGAPIRGARVALIFETPVGVVGWPGHLTQKARFGRVTHTTEPIHTTKPIHTVVFLVALRGLVFIPLK